MKRTIQQSLVVAIVAVVTAFALAVPVWARQGSDDNATQTETETHQSTSTTNTSNTSKTETKNETETETEVESARDKIRGKLDDAHKRVCETRTTVISKIMTDAAAAGQRHLNLFGDIATKVEDFYTAKKLSATGYAAAVANVNTKKVAAQTAVDAVKNAQTTVDCNGANPVGQVDGFKAKVEAMKTALKDLRTAVKDLIVIVKHALEAQGEGQ